MKQTNLDITAKERYSPAFPPDGKVLKWQLTASGERWTNRRKIWDKVMSSLKKLGKFLKESNILK